jgi:hypothetical protein
MDETAKNVIDIYGESLSLPAHRLCRVYENPTLYTMLPPNRIMSVGNFYSILRQRPAAKSAKSYE